VLNDGDDGNNNTRADAPSYRQDCEGMIQAKPTLPGRMSALSWPAAAAAAAVAAVRWIGLKG